jgi:hypothetical protein
MNLTIGLRGAQPTVQAAAPLFAEAERRFFLRVVDAQIEFPPTRTARLPTSSSIRTVAT